MPHSRDREDLAAFILRLRSERITEPRLLAAIEQVPRRLFVPGEVPNAYADGALPIDCGETMYGARFAVGLVHALKVEDHARVLEIGTGSGYVTALLAKLAARVFSLDRYKRLLRRADERLRGLDLLNVVLEQDDGRSGYITGAPYDRIIVHAAFSEVPRAFLEQLASQAYLICAVGPGDGEQQLVRLQKVGSRFEREDLRTVRYQPLASGIAATL
ncbi:protein-L-isoaspartate(D-aspartate) O-methyltransferase [Mangrovibrevibacter kandeliae]|uniref:protein-L-isoaspartate(D-aspartate) O-methyltransferase n=1 Tax=Mangrovibrevibacter kandeliae TaxID=2968473 RepID=UPI0021188487|nr:protein-L-isoaspartate(D-aspartate) O-methyltransferase [Aurantimonas sp. CSK15Z-1]MCQ8781761.1 protein-L-isoaspartate(D-aspartate) O-methyltransferase [Aurantimonas sp. CSK15Z-1]